VIAADRPSRFAVPVWVLFAAAVVICAGLYMLLSLRLAGRTDELATLARALPPADRAEIFRPPRETQPVVPQVQAEGVDFALLPLFMNGAPPGLRPALRGQESVSLADLVVQFTNPEVFQSSRAELTQGFEPLIASIGQVIAANLELIGNVTVVGHTDSIPVSATNPFVNNQGLSEARAQTIARILIASGVPADRIKAVGRAAADPVATNATRDGRALNRRVEILVEKRL
jgi:type VI secretion system protein ImpK